MSWTPLFSTCLRRYSDDGVGDDGGSWVQGSVGDACFIMLVQFCVGHGEENVWHCDGLLVVFWEMPSSGIAKHIYFQYVAHSDISNMLHTQTTGPPRSGSGVGVGILRGAGDSLV